MTDVIDLIGLDAQDEASLNIKHPKTNEPTGWVWTFYGPGHPATMAVADQVSRLALRRAAEQREAMANGLKWTAEKETPEDVRLQNIQNVVARTKSFTPVNLGDGAIEYSPEKARELLLDRRKGWLLGQIMTFLGKEESFIQPSAKG